MTRRSRDTRSGYGARLPAPAFLAASTGYEFGTGHATPLVARRMCLRCGDMQPTKGGRMLVNGVQLCSLHGRKEAA